MQWSNIKAEIQATANDSNFNTGGTYESYLQTWANRIVRLIHKHMGFHNSFLYTTTALDFTVDQNYVSLPSDFNYPASDPVANGTMLTRYTMDELHHSDPYNKSNADWPTRYDIRGLDTSGNLKMILNPIPSKSDYSKTITGTDSNYYDVTATHISSNSNKPITGGSYATYWTSSSKTSGDTWYPGYLYGYGLALPYYKQPSDMSSNTDTPDGIPADYHWLVIEGVLFMIYRWTNERDIRDNDVFKQLSPGIRELKGYMSQLQSDFMQFDPTARNR